VQGSIIYTLLLKSSAPASGIASVWLSELKLTGEIVPVPNTNASDLVVLSNQTQTRVIGTVAPTNYQFLPGSAIQLNVLVKTQSPVTPYLVWDLPTNLSASPALLPTSVKIPTLNPTQAQISFQTAQPRYGRNGTIVQANATCNCVEGKVIAVVTDSIGVYRLSGSMIMTAPNGSSIPVKGLQGSEYSLTYSYNASLTLGVWHLSLRLLDLDGNDYSWDQSIWSAPFTRVTLQIVDQTNEPVQSANLRVSDTLAQGAAWSAMTGSSGNATLLLPSSNVVGPLNITVSWDNGNSSQPIEVPYSAPTIRIPVYHFGVRPLLGGVIPLPGVAVQLSSSGMTIANVTTGLDGAGYFREFAGNYTARVYYLSSESHCSITADSNAVANCAVPVPQWVGYVAAILAVTVIVLVAAPIVRKKTKLQPVEFSYFNALTMGGLPNACFVVIMGPAGSGKSVLLASLAAEHLRNGSACIYVTNTDFPSKIREHMLTLGIHEKVAKSEKLVFVDSYSAISGVPSTERYNLTSHTDLTGLGLIITKCLEEFGPGMDLYLDSASPVLSSLRTSYLLDFLHSIAGKVKANGGKLVVAVGTVLDAADIPRFEEAADCVIETEVQESKRGQRRRLRIKKLRGKGYMDNWVRFQIEAGNGIVFLARKK
jgi:KaiC/GvpD/RAD55 family RecA-like ATPase